MRQRRRGWGTVPSGFVSGVTLVGGILVVDVSTARADTACTTSSISEYSIFTDDYMTAANANATAGTLHIKDRNLDTYCQGNSNFQTWSTVQNSTTKSGIIRQVEIGWEEQWFFQYPNWVHLWQLFTAVEVYPNETTNIVTTTSSCPCADYRF